MTFETLLAELRAGNVPNATQNEILLAICNEIQGLGESLQVLAIKHESHERELQLGRKIGAVKR